jgi:hypothetical protein
MKISQIALLGTFFATLTMVTSITFTVGATPFSNRIITITAVGNKNWLRSVYRKNI